MAEWYGLREGKAFINFGATVGHIAARVAVKGHLTTFAEVMAGRQSTAVPNPSWSHEALSPEETKTSHPRPGSSTPSRCMEVHNRGPH